MAKVEFTDSFQIIEGQITKEIEQRVKRASAYLDGQIKLKLTTGDRTGKWYRVPGTKDTMYQVSAPGEPPAKMLGGLSDSVNHVVKSTDTESIGTVGVNTEYAKRLEFGFDGKTDSLGRTYYMKPRPYMRSTYMEQKETLMKILRGEL